MAGLTNDVITQDGSYQFPVSQGEEYIALIDGNFGASTVTIGYTHPASGSQLDIADIEVSSLSPDSDREPTFIGVGSVMEINVANADGATALYVSVIPILR